MHATTGATRIATGIERVNRRQRFEQFCSSSRCDLRHVEIIYGLELVSGGRIRFSGRRGVPTAHTDRSIEVQISSDNALLLHRGVVLSPLILRLSHPCRAVREQRILLFLSCRHESVLVGRSLFLVLPHVVRV